MRMNSPASRGFVCSTAVTMPAPISELYCTMEKNSTPPSSSETKNDRAKSKRRNRRTGMKPRIRT